MDFPGGRTYFISRRNGRTFFKSSTRGGGFRSQLIYLLKNQIVDAVAVVKLEDGFPSVCITDNPETVKKAAGSKYTPVPVVGEIIKEIRFKPRKIGITALPCQLAALYAAGQFNKILSESVVFSIGLFCGDLKNYNSVKKIAESLYIPYPTDSTFQGWRCGPWPGKARFKMANGNVKEKDLEKWLNISVPFYALPRCFMCPARENWLADISLADNHQGKTDETVIVARTVKGYETLLAAKEDSQIILRQPWNKADKLFPENVRLTKLTSALSYIEYRKKKNLPVPEYDYPVDKILRPYRMLKEKIFGIKYSLCIWLRAGKQYEVIEKYPFLMEKVGGFVWRFPASIPGFRACVKILKFFGLKLENF